MWVNMTSLTYDLIVQSGRFDLLHEHILTLEGAANLSTAVLGVYALGVRNIAERKGYLCCRLTVSMSLLPRDENLPWIHKF